MGKKFNFTKEIQDEICLEVSTTPKMLEELCEEHPHWPKAKYIYKQRILNPAFGQDYLRAKQAQIEVLVSQILCLARNKKTALVELDDGTTIIDNNAVQWIKLEIDSIKWFAAKLAPKLYGDRNNKDDNDNEDFINRNRDKL